MVKVGLLGAGGIGAVHGAAYQRINRARVVAVADCVAEVADTLAAELGARAYYSVDDLLNDGEVEMVDICLPTHVHAEAVVRAAKAGKHILCEKPIARNLDEADRMIEAARQAGVKAMIAQVVRFWPAYATIKAIVEGGDLGAPLAATATRLVSHGRLGTGWHFDPERGGGALLDLHIHDLDYLCDLFGRPKSVYALGVRSESGTYDHVLTSLDYGETKATAEASFRMPAGFPITFDFRLLGDKGCAQYRFVGGRLGGEGGDENELTVYVSGQNPRRLSCPATDAFVAEIDYFVGCILDDRQPVMASLEEARSVLEVYLAAKQSLTTGQVVLL